MGQAALGQVGGKAQMDEQYFMQKVKLGQGTFGTVWRAKNRKTGETVAMKQMDKAVLPKRGVTRTDIEREVSMMQACDHANITKLYDTFEDKDSIYLALEYCEGGDFGDKVQERGPVITEDEVAQWVYQICASLSHLHGKGICHRDIKPDNFMVAQESNLKLADFGLAVFLPQGNLLSDKCGTPAFMAPEQHLMPKSSRGYGFAVDMWAAGVTMYMVMFGGKHPFLVKRGNRYDLDDQLLLSGTLDFTDNTNMAAQGLGFLGLANILKFSDPCRQFCQQLVTVSHTSRLTATVATRQPWVQRGRKPEMPKGRQASPEMQAQGEQAAVVRNNSKTPLVAPSPQAAAAGRVQPQAVAVAPGAPAPRGPGGYPQAGLGGQPPNGGAAAAAAGVAGVMGGVVGLFGMADQNQNQQEYQRQRVLEAENRRLQEALEKEKRDHKDLRTQRTKEMQHQAQAVHGQLDQTSAMAMGGEAFAARTLLPPHTKCKYEPATRNQFGVLPAVIESFNESDSTYNLDVKPHAQPNRIMPSDKISSAEAWPRGTLVWYYSERAANWLPARIACFNDSDSTYNLAQDAPGNLDLRQHAQCEFIRLRLDQRSVVPAGPPDVQDPATTAARPIDRRRTKPDVTQAASRAVEQHQSAPAPSAEGAIGPGFWCVVPEHGSVLAQIVRLQNGIADVNSGDATMQVALQSLRPPADATKAWRHGTQVQYQSSSAGGQWIDAHVESFNAYNNTYNLDVRQEASPDKVRPRYVQR
eukprot:TRINITY_DN22593_c0_g1_i1.p1 TRINITY_DN22593_c0_g1~~TRINITY_DN22593_c0_g1_i1.p1  ORF type:complete len:752 (+),score=124.12 TRINITY_DN22593_c0_g1_i1:133-2388(+)